MAGIEAMGQRVRRKVHADGQVVDVREPAGDMPVEMDGGRIESLSPPLVTLRTGDTVPVDAYVATGVTLKVGDVVAVARRGSFVLVLGKVVLL